MRAIKDLKESFEITWVSGEPESLIYDQGSRLSDDRKRPSSLRQEEVKLEDRETAIFERLKKKFEQT